MNKSTISKKPARKASANSGKDKSLAILTKPTLARLNANIEADKYLAFQIKAKQNLTDVTTLVNQWVDEYLEE